VKYIEQKVCKSEGTQDMRIEKEHQAQPSKKLLAKKGPNNRRPRVCHQGDAHNCCDFSSQIKHSPTSDRKYAKVVLVVDRNFEEPD